MAVSVNQISGIIEKRCPLSAACDWDNSGFQINFNNDVNSVLICVDVSPEVIEEASVLGCGLIISHHPLLFKPLSCIDIKSWIGRCVELLFKNQISLYSAHTSADNALYGLNFEFAQIIGLNGIEFMEPLQYEKYCKIVVFAPPKSVEVVKDAMFSAGAGNFNNYSRCCFSATGQGEFLPNENANPYIGSPNIVEKVEELRVEAILPASNLHQVLFAVKSSHPYEEPAIDIYDLEAPKLPSAGSGIYGCLQSKVPFKILLGILKEKLNMDYIRFSGDADKEVYKIAICCGAASEYAGLAVRLGADVFITGEIKHNIYLENTNSINFVELGHYESEKCFCAMMLNYLQTALSDVKYNLVVSVSEREKKPYFYF